MIAYLSISSDPSLTCSHVLAALESVKDTTLKRVLDISLAKQEELKRNRELLVKWWLETDFRASWEELGGQLLYHGETKALKNVLVYIKPQRGAWYIKCLLQKPVC